jgi:Mn-dependent DtxR family transcriptional regulator
MDTTISKETYLKAIAEAESEGEPVIAATVVRWLDVTPAAVTMEVRRLRRDGLVRVEPDGRLMLTDSGRGIAERIRFRHHLIERMLTEMFSMEWYKVHDEAERLEHAVSREFEAKLVERLGENGVCPHGYDIHGDSPANRRNRGLITLVEMETRNIGGNRMCLRAGQNTARVPRQAWHSARDAGKSSGAESRRNASNDPRLARVTAGTECGGKIWVRIIGSRE